MILPSFWSEIVERSDDNRFLVYDDGVIEDTKTELEWMVGPYEINHYQAENWVTGLRGNWRLPTVKELDGLYQLDKGKYNSVFLDMFVWSCELCDGYGEPTQSCNSSYAYGFTEDGLAWYCRSSSADYNPQSGIDFNVFAARYSGK